MEGEFAGLGELAVAGADQADRLHPLIPRNSNRWGDLYLGRGAVAHEFARLKNEWALSPLRVRGLDRLRPHADLTILAKLTCALAETRSRRNIRIGMATEPPSAPAKRGRLPRRPRHFAPYRLARFILVVLALIGVVALALLVLGLLNVDVVSDHFHIH